MNFWVAYCRSVTAVVEGFRRYEEKITTASAA
jgi:hypothetical protein